MKRIRIVLLAAAAALCSYPVTVYAQPDEEEEADDDDEYEDDDEEDDDDSDEEEDDDDDDSDDEDDDDDSDDEDDDDDSDDEDDDDDSDDEDDDGDGASDLDSICKIDPEACPTLNFEKEAARQIREPLYAVQQVFVLRGRRVELQPYWGFTLNDQFVSHDGPGLAFNYWITNALAVGLNGNYYLPFNSDSEFNLQTRRAARVGVPLTEYNWGAAFNFTYAPLMGKFAGFGDFIFQYDAYVVGGVGAISARPTPVIDPDNRSFEFQPKLSGNAGLGIHIFFNRWFAATLEVRDYVFQAELENVSVAAPPEDINQATFLDDTGELTNNVQAQVGFSVFFPFTFEYRLPK